jgi:hypothetical protein
VYIVVHTTRNVKALEESVNDDKSDFQAVIFGILAAGNKWVRTVAIEERRGG